MIKNNKQGPTKDQVGHSVVSNWRNDRDSYTKLEKDKNALLLFKLITHYFPPVSQISKNSIELAVEHYDDYVDLYKSIGLDQPVKRMWEP